MPDPIDWVARCITAEAQNAADAYLIGECVKCAEITDARERELEAEIDALKARALAAEVALETITRDVRALIDSSEGVAGLHLNGDVAEWSTLLAGGHFETWLMSLDEVPGLTAARELIRKAGEYDKALGLFENSAKPTPGNLMDYVTCLSDEFTRLYAKEESPEAAKIAAENAEKAKMLDTWAEAWELYCLAPSDCDDVERMAFVDADLKLRAYARKLAALQAARRES